MPGSSSIHDNDYISTAEVGKRFGYTSEYITLLAREGRIESKKIGNRWYVNSASAKNFFEAAEQERVARRQLVSEVRKAEFRSYGNVRQRFMPTRPIVGIFALSIVGLLLGAAGYLLNGDGQRASAITSYGDPNLELNYQGKLTDAANMAVPDGTYNMRFWLLTSPTIATTSAVWTESLTGTNKVSVENGLFSIMLGSTSPLTSVDFNQTLYLGVEVGGTSSPAWDGEMSPRKVLGTVPASFEAARLGGLTPTQFVRTDATSTIATTSASTLLTVTQSGTGDILNLFDGSTEVFTVLDGGNVGVGTTSPQSKLHVNGNIALPNGAQIRFDDGAGAYIVEESNGLRFYAGNVGSVLAMEINGNGKTQIGSAWFDSALTGNVGIGTTTPNYKLTVVGNALVQNFTATGTVTFSGLNDGILMTNSSGVVSVSTALDSAYLDAGVLLESEIGSSADLRALLNDETGTDLAVFSTNPLLSGFRSLASSTIGDGTATGGLTVYGNSTTTGNAYFAGNVGIGTTSPGTKLDVAGGRLRITNIGSAPTSGVGLETMYDPSNNRGLIYVFDRDASAYKDLYLGSSGGALVVKNTGNVGIGTTNPFGKLEIEGGVDSVPATSGTSSDFIFRYSPTGTSLALDFGGSASGGVYNWIQSRNSGAYSSNYSLALNPNGGNVGIGTTTPSAKLTVNGDIYGANLTATGTLTVSGVATLATLIGTNATITNATTTNLAATSFTLGSDYITDLTGTGLTLTNGVLSAAGGSNWLVANGALTPSTTVGLSIGASTTIGDGTATGGLTVYGNSTTTGDAYFGSNIGIGSTSPSAKLVVSGGAFDLTPASSEGTLGAELISNVADRDLSSDSGNWTGTNWTVGSGVVTHTAGNNALTLNNAALSSAPSAGNYYQIGFDINTTATGTPGLTVTFGGIVATPRYGVNADGSQTSQIVVVKAVSAGALTIAPNNATWTGTIDNVSIKQITPSALAQTIRNANGTAGIEFRAGGANLYSTFIGVDAGVANTTGVRNSFVGYQAGLSNTTGYSNAFVGFQSGSSNTTGYGNSALGGESLNSNTTGYANAAVGYQSLYTNTTGSSNSALGHFALNKNTTGNWNSAVGSQALYANTTGGSNSAFGMYALNLNTTGNANTASGVWSLRSNTTGSSNSAVGSYALLTNTTGGSNSALGDSVLRYNTTGTENSALGVASLYSNTTGSYNSAVGRSAGVNNTIGNYNAFFGNYAGSSNTTGSGNLYLGYQAADSQTTGDYNILLGYNNNLASTTGSNQLNIGNLIFGTGLGVNDSAATGNVGIGSTSPSQKLTVTGNIYSSGFVNVNSGYQQEGNTILYASSTNYSTRVGIGAGAVLLSDGAYNTAIGYHALYTATSSDYNTAIGYDALRLNTSGYNNTANGYYSLLSNTVGSENTGYGYQALASNTTGSLSTAIGSGALWNSSTGYGNTAVGGYALSNNTTGYQNIALGQIAGRYLSNGSSPNATSTNSVFLGYDSRAAVAGGTNEIVIGHTAIGNGSNSVTLGNTSITKTILQGNVGIGTTTPSAKLTVNGDIYSSGYINSSSGYQQEGNTILYASSTNYSTRVGIGAGAALLSDGAYNTAIGYGALQTSTTSTFNTAIGSNALFSNTTGNYNVGIGSNALLNNTTGISNVAIGLDTLKLNTTGTSNTVIGTNALYSNSTGSNNTANGSNALYANTVGDFNTAVGSTALNVNTTGYNNVAIGSQALLFNKTGYQNSALGYMAGRFLADGSSANGTSTNSIFLGYDTRASVANGTNEIVIGASTIGNGSNSVTLGNTSITKTILQGNIGIGSTSPSAKLVVSGGAFDLTPASSEGTLGAELISNVADRDLSSDSGNWTGTNWTVGSGKVTHTVGNNALTLNNAALSSAPSAGDYYQIGFDINTTAIGTPGVSVTFGGSVASPRYGINTGNQTSQVVVVKAVSAGALTIAPNNATWTGTIDNVSIKQITPSALAQTIRNANGTAGIEFRAGGASLFNTFMGVEAGLANTMGNKNAFLGYQAGSLNTIGDSNAFLGYRAGYTNTTGASNSFIGSEAGYANTTGSNNSFVGTGAGYTNLTGLNNTFMGYRAGYANTSGSSNVFMGSVAGNANTTGSNNAFVGLYAGYSNTTGGSNAFLGMSAGETNTTGSNNAFVGMNAGKLNTTGGNNAFIGSWSGYNNTTGGDSAFLGFQAGYANTTGTGNSFVGYQAGYSNVTGYFNIAIGRIAGRYLADGSANGTSTNSLFLGYDTRASIANGDNEIVIGTSAIGNGSNSVTLGSTAITKTILQGNVGIGSTTPSSILTISNSASTAANTSLFTIASTTGGTSTTTLMTVLANGSIGIGTSTPATALQVIGDIRVGVSGTDGCVQGFGGATLTGTCSSDERLKTNIVDVRGVLDKFTDLRVITYNWNETAHDIYKNDVISTQTGFLAQNVEMLFPELVSTDTKGYKRVDYSTLSLYTAQAVHELSFNVLTDNRIVSLYASEEDIHSGHIVALNLSSQEENEIRLATASDEVLGIVGDVSTSTILSNGASGVAVVSGGRASILVTDENGKVEKGDMLTVSVTQPGYAMKQAENGRSLGHALTDAEQDGTSTITMIVESSERTISLSGIDGEDLISSAEQAVRGNATVGEQFKEKLIDGLTVVREYTAVHLKAVVGYFDKIFAKEVHTDLVCVGDVCVDEATFLKVLQNANVTPLSSDDNATTTVNTADIENGQPDTVIEPTSQMVNEEPLTSSEALPVEDEVTTGTTTEIILEETSETVQASNEEPAAPETTSEILAEMEQDTVTLEPLETVISESQTNI